MLKKNGRTSGQERHQIGEIAPCCSDFFWRFPQLVRAFRPFSSHCFLLPLPTHAQSVVLSSLFACLATELAFGFYPLLKCLFSASR